MGKKSAALPDRKTLKAGEPPDLAPNASVRLRSEPAKAWGAFLDLAVSLELEGPSDWSERLDYYLPEKKYFGGEGGDDEKRPSLQDDRRK